MKEAEKQKGNPLNIFIFLGIAAFSMVSLLPNNGSSQLSTFLPYALIIILYLRTIFLENRIEKLEKRK